MATGALELCFVLLILLSLNLCRSDLKYRALPNQTVALVFTLCLLVNLLLEIGFNVIYGTASIVIFGMVLFALGVFGAGDIKLFAAYSVAIHPQFLYSTLLLILLLGGVQAGLILIYRWACRIERDRRGLPYGLPIIAGCLLSIGVSAQV